MRRCVTSWRLAGAVPRVVTGPTEGRTFSDFAKKVGADLGMPPDEDQCEILDAIYRVEGDDPSVPACFEVAIIAPRQNIKTSTFEIAALTDLFVFRERLQIWTAHLYSTSSKTFEHMRDLIEPVDEYRELCKWPPRVANGDQSIDLLTGESIEFYARSKKAARGFPGVAKIVLDEALFLNPGDLGALLPTTAVVPGAQIRYASSAGMADSEALRAIRNRGRDGEDGLAYFEWYADWQPCADENCTHKFGHVEGCALDDPELWAEANPALGRRISKRRLRDFRKSMPADEFAREFLTWWDEGPEEGGGPFGQGVWDKLLSADSEITGRPSFAVAVAGNRKWAAIGACGSGPDGLHVEVGDYRRSTDWVVGRCRELAAKHPGVGFVLRTNAAAGALIADFEAAGLKIVKASQQDYAQACGDFTDAVMGAELRHGGQRELSVAVDGTRKKDVGDGFCWDQKKSTVDNSPLEAVTLAHWAASKPKRSGRLLIL